MTNENTVFVVDDDEAVRESLQALLEAAGYRVKAFPDGESFLKNHGNVKVGCVLLDVTMPGLSGLEVQQRMIGEKIDFPILMVTGDADVPMAVKALTAGAVDFIEKPYQDIAILEKVRDALASSEERNRKTVETQDIQARIERLTNRERDVLGQLKHGLQNKIIAQKLGISHRTVEIYRARVMDKMKADNLAHLVKMVMSLGPIETED